MDTTSIGKFLILIGIVIAVGGILLLFMPKLPLIGRLPGDILIKRDGFTFYLPFTSSIILSLLMTLFINLFTRR